jgi:hypothetical protein
MTTPNTPTTEQPWFTIPGVAGLPEVHVPRFDVPKLDLPKVDLPQIADDAKERITTTAKDVRKNVEHTVVLIRELVGV